MVHFTATVLSAWRWALKMLAGSDAYAAALVLYNNIKFLAKNKQPGAQAAYDDLAQRFPGGGGGRPPKPLKG